MTAQIFEFPENSGIAWHHIAPHVHQCALERSNSREIADRVMETVRQAYERSVPAKFSLLPESVQSKPEDDAPQYLSPYIRTRQKEPPRITDEHVQIVSGRFSKLVGLLIKELTIIATDAEMLAADHDPHNHRDR
jgi:hypothetical protein